ncbi:MAG TPA: histidine phosphatase family protein [Gemmatimonadales bacterium]|nr:histidine phosphatase family protein [Gemmatimonadales bacterium]
MKLLLIRHADAGERDGERWPDDRDRPITDKGERRQEKMAKRLRKLGFKPTLVLSSPWKRAWQTAEITSRVMDCPAPVASDALAAAPSLTRLASAIGRRGAEEVVALVGHEPWMGELAARLLTGEPNGLNIAWAKSGVMLLDAAQVRPGEATLEMFLRPKG